MVDRYQLVRSLVVLAALLHIGVVQAADNAKPESGEEQRNSQSGYDRIAEFGGPDGVSEQLKQADQLRAPIFEWEAPGR